MILKENRFIERLFHWKVVSLEGYLTERSSRRKLSFHWLPHCCFPTENSLRTENDHRKWFESNFTVWHAMSDDHPEPSPAYLQFHAVFSRNRAPIVARFVLVSLLRLSVRLGEHYKEGRASAERVLVDETAATLVQICKPCKQCHVSTSM